MVGPILDGLNPDLRIGRVQVRDDRRKCFDDFACGFHGVDGSVPMSVNVVGLILLCPLPPSFPFSRDERVFRVDFTEPSIAAGLTSIGVWHLGQVMIFTIQFLSHSQGLSCVVAMWRG